MGKLMDNLQRQLKTEYKKDAEDCIKIYETIKEGTGYVWESDWNPLTRVRFEGTYPNRKRIYKPSIIGYTYLKGIENENNTDYK
jgi:hypothetical protein